MSFRLDQLLQASTVRVSASGKAYEGMGFFFAPGLALTSAYVVPQAEGEMVQVFLPGEKHAVPAEVKYRFQDEVGLIILQVQTTEALPCAYLDADIKPGDQGYSFACTAKSRKMQRVMLECEGMMGSAIGISQLAGRNKHLKLNGAPILNQRTGKVCGIVHTPKKGPAHRGEAVPMGVLFSEFPALSILQKEYHCQDHRWTTLLHPDLEALSGDWSYYNRGWIRREQSIRALLFLLRTASQWALIGARMRHVFPWRSMIALIKQTFRGNLGDELQRQYSYITRQLATSVDPNSAAQARTLHRLDAQSWVISRLMDMLISPEQDYASSSRLLWMLEIMNEQRVYIQTLKRMPGNFYPQLETFKQRWKLLEHDDKQIDTSLVLSGLINRNTDTNFSLWYTMKFFLKDFIMDLTQNSKLSAHGLERLFNVLIVNLRHAVPTPTASVEDLLRDLEEEVRQNPELKVLQKVQILMTSVSGEPVQGGPYRALKGSNTYHFSSKCKLYPARAQAEELSQIICYDTEAEASQQHQPCPNCLTAAKLLDRRLSDWQEVEQPDIASTLEVPSGLEPTTTVQSTATVTLRPVEQAAATSATVTTTDVVSTDNTAIAEHSPAVPKMQLPVTERAMTAAPAADAPLPEIPTELTAPMPIAASAQQSVDSAPNHTDQAASTEASVEPAAVAPTIEATATLSNDPSVVAAAYTEAIATAANQAEAAHAAADLDAEEDLDVIAAQVETELAAAITAVAQELATESQQSTPAQPLDDAIMPTEADLHAINIDESSDEDEDGLAMATFFIPEGDQPAFELTEATAAEVPETVIQAPVNAVEVSADRMTDHQPSPNAAKPRTTTRTSRSTKQPKTLKDFVAAISGSRKAMEPTVVAQAQSSEDEHPAAAPETPSKVVDFVSKQTKPHRANKDRATTANQAPKTMSRVVGAGSPNTAKNEKVAAKAVPQSAKSVKVDAATVKTAKTSSKTATQSPKTDTAMDQAVATDSTPTSKLEPAATISPKTTQKSSTSNHKSPKAATSARKKSSTGTATTTSKPAALPSKTRTKSTKAKRMADWTTPDATSASIDEDVTGEITAVTSSAKTKSTSAKPKSTRKRSSRSTSARRTTQD